jgi:hypothetical protein
MDKNKKFIERLKTIFGDKYDYSKVNFIERTVPITLICPQHGEFEIKPRYIVENIKICPNCKDKKFPGFWNIKENCINAVSNCNSITELKTNYGGAIDSIRKNGWFEELTLHLERKHNGRPKETFINILSDEELIKKYIGLEFGSFKIIKYDGKKPQSKTSSHKRHFFTKQCQFCGIERSVPIFQINYCIKSNHVMCNTCNETYNIFTTEKKCSSCNEWKPATSEYFASSKNRPFGLHYYCLDCHRERNRKRRQEDPNVYVKEHLRQKWRYENEPFYKLKNNLRSRITMALKLQKWKKNGNTTKLLGCDFKTVEKYIEDQFTEGMNWDNHGTHGWHIDHTIPLSKAETPEEIEKLFHYTNLKPLWAFDNLSKGGYKGK